MGQRRNQKRNQKHLKKNKNVNINMVKFMKYSKNSSVRKFTMINTYFKKQEKSHTQSNFTLMN